MIAYVLSVHCPMPIWDINLGCTFGTQVGMVSWGTAKFDLNKSWPFQGVCLSSTECNSKSGTADGNCASGFGVCCTFK